MIVKIQANALNITAEELLKHIPEKDLLKIKEDYAHPYFQAYSIVQEGMSKPKVLGKGINPIKWTKDAVRTVKGAIKKGLQFFIGHNKDNSTENRKSIGEVVADFSKTIDDKLQHIVIGLFPSRKEAQYYDTCSIEANVKMREYNDLSIAEKIESLTGIALGNLQKDSPAFPGAVKVGAIQCFNESDEDSKKNNPVEPDGKKGEPMPDKISFHDIKQAVSDMNIFASQLYKEDDIKNDNGFKDMFNKMTDNLIPESEVEKKIKEKDNRIAELEKTVNVSQAPAMLKKVMPEGLTEKQKVFIEKKFNPEELEDLTEEGLKKFVDKSQKEYSDYAEIFNDKKNTSEPEGDIKKDVDTDDPVKDVVNQVLK